MEHKESKKPNPFMKAFVLLIGLIIAFIFYHNVSTTNILEGLFAVVDGNVGEFSSQSDFEKEDQDSLVKLVAGLWEFQSEPNDTLTILDRIEVTDNGYIWKVEQVEITLPSGIKKNIIHLFHAFLFPSSRSAFDTTYINCVIRNLTQLWVYENDTCEITKYQGFKKGKEVIENAFADIIVENFKDEVEDLFFDSTLFIRKGRKYHRYESEDIQSFFPGNLVEIAYNLSSVDHNKKDEAYTVKDKEVHLSNADIKNPSIHLNMYSECRGDYSVRDLMRRSITEDLQSVKVAGRNPEQVQSLIDCYYVPFCLEAKLNSIVLTRKEELEKLVVDFDVTWQGAVDNVSLNITGNSIDKKRWENELLKEINLWKFQPVQKEAPHITVSFTKAL